MPTPLPHNFCMTRNASKQIDSDIARPEIEPELPTGTKRRPLYEWRTHNRQDHDNNNYADTSNNHTAEFFLSVLTSGRLRLPQTMMRTTTTTTTTSTLATLLTFWTRSIHTPPLIISDVEQMMTKNDQPDGHRRQLLAVVVTTLPPCILSTVQYWTYSQLFCRKVSKWTLSLTYEESPTVL